MVFRQRLELGRRRSKSLDQHGAVAMIAKIPPSRRPALLQYPLDPIAALDDAEISRSDDRRVSLVGFPNAGEATMPARHSHGRLWGRRSIISDACAAVTGARRRDGRLGKRSGPG
jgi:hypothetical protein